MADPMAGSINLIRNVMGLPFAPQLALLVMLLETLGAVMLAIGLWTRPVALAIAVQMAGICYALGPTWPWIDRGIEFPVLMLFLALYIAARGGGRYAVDRKIKYPLSSSRDSRWPSARRCSPSPARHRRAATMPSGRSRSRPTARMPCRRCS